MEEERAPEGSEHYAVGLARAFGGAIIFSYPLMMTMEMWRLGFYVDRLRLLVFLLLTLVVLGGLSWFAGFEEVRRPRSAALDALSAFGVAVVASSLALVCFGVVTSEMELGEIVGKIALQSVPSSIGAVVSRKQLRAKDEAQEERRERGAHYRGQLFLMFAGAIFLALNVAPTDEMVLIAYKMGPWHGVALVVISIVLLHAFVYTVGFGGQERVPEGSTQWKAFIHYTIAGYGLAVLVSLYVLWTFGRTDGAPLALVAIMVVVLAFPAALGAAIARLLV